MMMTSPLSFTTGSPISFDESNRTTTYEFNGLPSRHGTSATTKTAVDNDEDESMSKSSSMTNFDVSNNGTSNKYGSNGGVLSESSNGQGRRYNPMPNLATKLAAAATWRPTILVVDDSAMNRKVDT